MALVTITSDWNKSDYYLPVLKGRLFTLCKALGEPLQIVDISNTISHFDVFEACFVLKHSFRSFPEGTVHIMAVNSSSLESGRLLIVKAYGQYFIGMDDGRFSLLFSDVEGVEAYSADNGGLQEEADIYCRAVELVIRKVNLSPVVLHCAGAEKPVVMIDKISGRIVYIDSYGNAITNISKYDFLRVYDLAADSVEKPDELGFVIYVGGPSLKFKEIHDGYDSVSSGEHVAFFNSLDLLELAVNKGNFASLEGVGTITEVLVKFK